ncbi:DNA alkylation repair protein [Emticicia sp. 21SJ11W-3]|uniref:DNA alkylation repair protein n=1 Tax=Emticicia sp. 21SJ11W-3 TaxID=2916755 RepID=UPI0020A1C7B2|nr:DNA alkylation repair protein [Emticicia sp. 21SJ11W-3]UTA67399.1 DNA alkylation repair protein [Emticicia sp. 21SJ11W-3]
MNELISELQAIATPERAKTSAWFFKTGKGQYGEGDIFIGITTPQLRGICKKYQALPLNEIQVLLDDPIHEYRMAALMILVNQMKKAKGDTKRVIYEFYIKNLHNINNWDLVDCSARDIVGNYLFDKDRRILYDMAHSAHLWTQRVAIIASWYFINKQQYDDTLQIAEILLPHKHDLIHKAVGWMLREIWKKESAVGNRQNKVELFLEKNIRNIPRTALRYSIEKMNDERRKYFMQLK